MCVREVINISAAIITILVFLSGKADVSEFFSFFSSTSIVQESTSASKKYAIDSSEYDSQEGNIIYSKLVDKTKTALIFALESFIATLKGIIVFYLLLVSVFLSILLFFIDIFFGTTTIPQLWAWSWGTITIDWFWNETEGKHIIIGCIGIMVVSLLEDKWRSRT